MNPPRWDTRNAVIVREELMRRVGEQSDVDQPMPARPRDLTNVARSVVAVMIMAIVVVPASVFALTATPRPQVGASSAAPSQASTATRGVDLEPAAALVGLWKVQAPGEGANTWVRFEPASVTVQRGRDLINASWVSGGDHIAANAYGWSNGSMDRAVTWLEQAHTFRINGAEVVLVDSKDHVLATLSPATKAPDPRGALPELMNGRTPEAEVTSYFTPPTPAASPGPNVTADAVQGRWITGKADADGNHPFLTFSPDGSYRGSDGCNGISGRWLLSTTNYLAFTGGFHTDVACENLLPVPTWTADARTVSVHGDRLTLFDQKGTALGSFTRE